MANPGPMTCPRCAEPVRPRDRFCEKCGARVRLTSDDRNRVEVGLRAAAGVSDRGWRHHRNEDALALRVLEPARDRVAATVAILCDGMSSAARPEEASEAAAEAAAETLVAALRARRGPAAATREAIHAAGDAVAGLAGAGRNAPACTFVSAVLTGGVVTVGWIGDSRAYWIPLPGTGSLPPTQLTEDDSWLTQVLAAGTLSMAQATADRRAHAITAWLGRGAAPAEPHVVTVEPHGPGVVVVCTDGLWNYLGTVEEISAALPGQAHETPLDAARALVEIALRCGGHDNVTVAVLPFGAGQVGTNADCTPPGGTS